jgi:hypothetical protein
VSPSVFAVCFLLGAVSVAFWIDARFPRLAPKTMRSALFHVGGTMVAAQLLMPLAVHFLIGSPVTTLVTVFVLGLPALVYTLLAGIWLLRLVTDMWRSLSR